MLSERFPRPHPNRKPKGSVIRQCPSLSVAMGEGGLWLHRRTVSFVSREWRVLDSYQTQHTVQRWRQRVCLSYDSALYWIGALTSDTSVAVWLFLPHTPVTNNASRPTGPVTNHISLCNTPQQMISTPVTNNTHIVVTFLTNKHLLLRHPYNH